MYTLQFLTELLFTYDTEKDAVYSPIMAIAIDYEQVKVILTSLALICDGLHMMKHLWNVLISKLLNQKLYSC